MALETGRIATPLDEGRAQVLIDTLFGGLNPVSGANRTEALATARKLQFPRHSAE